MKLRLENQEAIIFLSVVEGLNTQDIPTLKGGIGKLVQDQKNQPKKKPIAVDFAAIHPSSLDNDALKKELEQIRLAASEHGVTLVLVSQVSSFGDVPNREEVAAFVASPISRLMTLETRLKNQYKALGEHKAKIEEEIKKNQGEIQVDIKTIMKENGELKARINQLEGLIRQILRARGARPLNTSAHLEKHSLAERILVSLLEKEGILPVL